MKPKPPTRKLRRQPDIEQLRRQAKELLADYTAGETAAVTEVSTHYRNADRATFALHDAQLVLARGYGFTSWPKLKAYVDGATVERLCEAVRAGDIERVFSMLKARPELAQMDLSENNEHRALHYAVFERNADMVRLLMQHGADARQGIYPQRDATRALTIATERGYDEIVAIIHEEEQRRRAAAENLSATQTDANAADTHEADKLNEAIYHGDDAQAFAMLDANPALTHATGRRWSPLHVSVAMLNLRLVEWLLDHGANPNQPSDQGLPPLDLLGRFASAPRHEQTIAVSSLLLRHGAEPTSRWAVATGEAEWIRARHAAGKLTNPADGDGLLSIAVKHDRRAILKLLLDLGFDPDERTRVAGLEDVIYTWGMPLQHCAGSGKLAMAKMLLEYGADPNGEIYAAGTPVSTAYRARDEAMLKLLQDHGGVLQAATAGYHRDTDLARKMLEDEAAGRLPRGAVPQGSTVAEQLLDGDCGEPEIIRLALERVDWPPDHDRWKSALRAPLAFWNHIPWIESEKWPFDRGT